MNTEIKVRLKLLVQGAKRFSSQECEENPKNVKTETINVESFKRGKRFNEQLTISTPKNKLVAQIIQISKESYAYMTDPKLPPTYKLAKKVMVPKVVSIVNGKPVKKPVESTVWAQYNDELRLKYHLSKIAETLGAESFSFEVLED